MDHFPYQPVPANKPPSSSSHPTGNFIADKTSSDLMSVSNGVDNSSVVAPPRSKFASFTNKQREWMFAALAIANGHDFKRNGVITDVTIEVARDHLAVWGPELTGIHREPSFNSMRRLWKNFLCPELSIHKDTTNLGGRPRKSPEPKKKHYKHKKSKKVTNG